MTPMICDQFDRRQTRLPRLGPASGHRELLTNLSKAIRVFAGCLLLAGCVSTPKPIFEENPAAPAWPAPPLAARIRYVGALRGEADLKAPPRLWQGLSTFFAGRPPPQLLFGPRGLCVSDSGSIVWVADPGGRCLHRFDLDLRRYQKVHRLADPQPGGQTALLSPVAICPGPEGELFVCDSEEVAVHRISADDGSFRGTLRLPDEIQRPVAVQFDRSTGELYVLDSMAHDIKVLVPDGAFRRIIGRRGVGPGEFNFPSDLKLDGDRLWIADTGNHRVQAISKNGEPIVAFGRAGDAPGDLALPKAVDLDPDGHVYVVDGRFENVQVFDRTGNLLLFFGEEGVGPGQFWLPGDIHIERSGRIWVCDSYNRRLQVFEYLVDATASP